MICCLLGGTVQIVQPFGSETVHPVVDVMAYDFPWIVLTFMIRIKVVTAFPSSGYKRKAESA